MASTKPTPASLLRILKLVWLALFRPDRFTDEERADSAVLNGQTERENVPRVYKIRRALFQSLMMCLGALAAGSVCGWLVRAAVGTQLTIAVTLIVIGTTILLWATLALQGWDIQSWGGATLGERLNRWVFRFLYTAGTYLVVFGSVWSIS